MGIDVLASRRQFLTGVAAAVPAALVAQGTAVAASPPERIAVPRMKLSLAAYSFNKMLPRRGSPESAAKATMKLEDFIRYCAEQNLGACEPTGYYFAETITPEYLLSIKNLAFRYGLDISGTAIGNDFCLPAGEKRDAQLAMTREWIEYAAVIGAPVIRIFAGKVPEGDSEDAAVERCIEGINASLDHAAKYGIFLGLENHGGITATADMLLRIVKGVKESPWFGINFDSGNFGSDDPYAELAKIAPYAVNAQIKASIKRGGKKEPSDLARVVGILKDAGYRGYLALEYEDETDPYEAIPPLLNRLRELIG